MAEFEPKTIFCGTFQIFRNWFSAVNVEMGKNELRRATSEFEVRITSLNDQQTTSR